MFTNIKTFVRINDDIIEMIKNAEGKIERYRNSIGKPHWALVSFLKDNVNDELRTFIKNNEGCHAYLHNARSWVNPMWLEGEEGNDDLFIGISMSSLTEQQSNSLIGIRGIHEINEVYAVEKVAEGLYGISLDSFGVIPKQISPQDLPLHCTMATKGANSPTIFMEKEKEQTTTVNDKEITFKSWVEKLDLFYEYSDSLSVFKAGQKRLNDTIEKGISELGLTKAQCDKFVADVYKSQLG